MRRTLRLLLLTALAILLVPMAARLLPQNARQNPQAPTAPAESPTYYRVLETETGKLHEVSVRDYLIGAVSAEMPASYEPEALKAQAVAVHTYAERIKRQNAETGMLGSADFTDDPQSYQGFYTDTQLRTLWGAQYEQNYRKIASAVDAVSGLLLCYQNEPIIAAFHAVSAGMTESAANVWGNDLPYLAAVESAGDCFAPQFENTLQLSPESLRKALTAVKPDLTFPDDPAEWLNILERSSSGTVLRTEAGSAEFTGQQIRDALGLRSADFTAAYGDGMFLFVTKGCGHFVGMSQYGANNMAQNGAGFKEILQHYYPGTELQLT